MYRHAIRLSVLIAWILAGSHLAVADDVATMPSRVKPPKFTLRAATVETFGEQPFVSLTIEVSNPNAASLVYTGYTADSFSPVLEPGHIAPLFQIELKQDEKWQAQPMGFCGTGLADIELAPGSSATFGVAVPVGEWQAVKVAIRHDAGWSDDENTTTTTWTAEFTREQIEKLR